MTQEWLGEGIDVNLWTLTPGRHHPVGVGCQLICRCVFSTGQSVPQWIISVASGVIKSQQNPIDELCIYHETEKSDPKHFRNRVLRMFHGILELEHE